LNLAEPKALVSDDLRERGGRFVKRLAHQVLPIVEKIPGKFSAVEKIEDPK